MSQIRLYLDEDAIESALVQALRSFDVDVLTVSDTNRHSFPDEEQLLWAAEQGRAIYSFNMGDFCRLHRDFITHERSHAGIILAPQQRYSVGEQLRGFLKLTAEKLAEDIINQLVFLSAYIEMKPPRCKQRGISIKKERVVHLCAVSDTLCSGL